jgi:putative flavoprotein involved in K+ transport
MNQQQLDVLIIGGGQAGLALGYHLCRTPVKFQIIERHARLGESWRQRYDSLVLFSPRAYSALPGLPLPGNPEGFANKDEFADYLVEYAARFRLPVRLGTAVTRLERAGTGFTLTLAGGKTLSARAIVLATGGFQLGNVPSLARHLVPELLQLTAADYRRPQQIPPGTVLVVGDGASGRDIAGDLSRSHTVYLATGRPRRLSPPKVLGINSWWWLERLGILHMPANSFLGRRMRASDPFPYRDNDLDTLRRKGVRVVGRLTALTGDEVTFAGGQTGIVTARITAVVWATGYRDDSDWVAIPEVKDARGNFIHQEGVSLVPGLYFIGRSWQRSRGSALITGVGADARLLATQLAIAIA